MARLRTFIAVALEKSIRERTVALQNILMRAGAEVNWVEPDNLHITLLFLGEVEDRDLPAVCQAAAGACQNITPFPLSIETAGCFPNLRRPRVLWVGVGEGAEALVDLHDALETPLLDLGCYRREERQYTPHLTLGRVKGDRPTDRLAAALAKHASWQGGQMSVREIQILSSELRPRGPTYTLLSRTRLSGRPVQE